MYRQMSISEKAASVQQRRQEIEEAYIRELSRKSSILEEKINIAVFKAHSFRSEQVCAYMPL